MQRKRTALEIRFWKKVDKNGPNGCWLWTASKVKSGGYGQIMGSREQGPLRAHCLSYEWAYGSIPDGMFVCHTCDTPACVNPAHLFLGTQVDNMQDCKTKGRMSYPPHFKGDNHPLRKHPEKAAHGEHHGMAKLTMAQVEEIKRRVNAGEMQKDIAPEYGVHPDSISRIMRGVTWK